MYDYSLWHVCLNQAVDKRELYSNLKKILVIFKLTCLLGHWIVKSFIFFNDVWERDGNQLMHLIIIRNSEAIQVCFFKYCTFIVHFGKDSKTRVIWSLKLISFSLYVYIKLFSVVLRTISGFFYSDYGHSFPHLSIHRNTLHILFI